MTTRPHRGITFVATIGLAMTGLLGSPAVAGAATGEESVTVTSTVTPGAPATGPSTGGAVIKLTPPTFTQNYVNSGNSTHTTWGLWPDGSIHYWSDGMAGPQLLPAPAGVAYRQIAANTFTAYGLSTGGVLYAWGHGSSGLLGNGNLYDVATPVLVSIPAGNQIAAVATNNHTAYALTTDGRLFAWGWFPPEGTCGGAVCFGHTEVLPVQVPIPSGARLTQIYADGDQEFYAWDAAHNLYVWQGDNNNGESVVPAPAGSTFTPPTAPPATVALTNVWFNIAYSSGPTNITSSGGSWLATTPALMECGPVDVVVWYTYAGVQLKATVPGGYILTTPCAPTSVRATAGSGQVSVSFAAPPPAYPGQPAPTSYTVTASPSSGSAVSATGPGSPIVVSGLTNGTSYSIKVIATNSFGDGGWGDQSGFQGTLLVTPKAVPTLTLNAAPTSGSATSADSVVLTGTLGGAGTLGGRAIVFTINGVDHPATTNASGVATFTINSPAAGTYGFGARFAGDAATAAVTASPITGYIVLALTPQAALSITGVPGSLTYGDSGFGLGTSGGSGSGAVTFSVPVGNRVLTVDPTGAVSVVGAGTVTVTATKAASGNYAPASTAMSVTVGRRAVAVTADNQSKVFGAADPVLTYSVSPALVAGDSLIGSLTYSGTNVGTYDIVPGTPFANPNYAITFVKGTMTITPRPLSAGMVTAGSTFPYTGTQIRPAVTVSDSAARLIAGTDYTVGYGANTTVAEGGTITVTGTGNYSGVVPLSFTIAPMPVTVTAANQTKEFGAPDPALTYSVDKALLAGDSLTGSLTYTGTNVGSYDIVQDIPIGNPNYAVTFVSGTMTITQSAAAQAAIDLVNALPQTVSNSTDADVVARATNAYDALSVADQSQIPAPVLTALQTAQAAAAAVNHVDSVNGVAASGAALPWSARLTVVPTPQTAALLDQLPGKDLLALYGISFVDTLTGTAWEPATGQSVTITLAQVDIAGRTGIGITHQRADGTLETVPATVNADGTISFAGTSFSLYGVTATAPAHTVTFDANGGRGSMAAQTTNLPTMLSKSKFELPSYSFAGWNTAPDGTGTAYDRYAIFDFRSDLVLYAQWQKNGKGR